LRTSINLIHISGAVTRYVTLVVMTILVVPVVVRLLITPQIRFTEESYNPILASLASIMVGLPSVVAFLLISNSIVYFCIISGITIFAFVSLFSANRSTINTVLAIMILVVISAFVMMPYQTAVQPANEYRMLSPTQPSFLERSLRNLQILGEVTPCSYQLIGWKEQILFYKETCTSNSKVYQFNPQTESVLGSPGSIATESLHVDRRSHTEVLHLFQADWIVPSEAELPSIELSRRGDALVSPDNKWLAIVAKHVYGPADILVVTPTQ
jgi:hypothetical protein